MPSRNIPSLVGALEPPLYSTIIHGLLPNQRDSIWTENNSNNNTNINTNDNHNNDNNNYKNMGIYIK